jgi:hypothetical protein
MPSGSWGYLSLGSGCNGSVDRRLAADYENVNPQAREFARKSGETIEAATGARRYRRREQSRPVAKANLPGRRR